MTTQPQNGTALAPAQGAYGTTLAQARQVSTQLGPQNLEQLWALAEALAKSDFVPPAFVGKPANVISVYFMAQDLGVGLTVAMREIDPIEGRPAARAAFKVALVLQSGLADSWDVMESTAQSCTIRTKRRGKREATSLTLTMAEVEAGGFHLDKGGGLKKNWRQYPRIMLRHRVESWLTDQEYPDVVRGLHTPEEIGETVEETPRVVNVPGDTAAVIPVGPPKPSADLPPLPKAEQHDPVTGEVDAPAPPGAAPTAEPTGPFIPAKDDVDRLLNQIHLVADETEYARMREDVERLTPKGHARRDQVVRAMRAKRTQLDAEAKK